MTEPASPIALCFSDSAQWRRFKHLQDLILRSRNTVFTVFFRWSEVTTSTSPPLILMSARALSVEGQIYEIPKSKVDRGIIKST